MKIIDILKRKAPSVSFEFFPPKNPELEHILFDTIESLKGEGADFASVTFGAGGSSSDKTLAWTCRIKESCGIAAMMHLTCVGFRKSQVDGLFDMLKSAGVHNILALRGDMPKDMPPEGLSMEFPHASDLVSYIKSSGYDFCVGVAGYPETHPESLSEKDDIDMLKAKLDAGGDFVITQLFFDNDKFYRFRDRLASSGVRVPVVAGIMPVVSASQVVNFTKMCRATLPENLLKGITGRPEEDVIAVGVDYAARQCVDLIKNGVDGLHFYTLNRSAATKSVMERLKKSGALPA